jgi:hypothetical protein
MSPRLDWCWLVSFPQLSDESLCRRVSGNAGDFRGHRAPIEHRDRQPVLDRRTRRGSGEGVEAAGLFVRCSCSPGCPVRILGPTDDTIAQGVPAGRGRSTGWIALSSSSSEVARRGGTPSRLAAASWDSAGPPTVPEQREQAGRRTADRAAKRGEHRGAVRRSRLRQTGGPPRRTVG